VEELVVPELQLELLLEQGLTVLLPVEPLPLVLNLKACILGQVEDSFQMGEVVLADLPSFCHLGLLRHLLVGLVRLQLELQLLAQVLTQR